MTAINFYNQYHNPSDNKVQTREQHESIIKKVEAAVARKKALNGHY